MARRTRDSCGVSRSSTQPVAWRRENGHDYVGALAIGEGYVRLVGRDPDSSLEVSFSIPFGEIEAVSRGRAGEIVLELAGSQAIWLSPVDDRPALAERIRVAVQG